jgi:hypothetical protein
VAREPHNEQGIEAESADDDEEKAILETRAV